MGYRLIHGRWTRRISRQDADSDSEDEIHTTEVGSSGTAGTKVEDDSEPSTPPPPTAVATPRAPRSHIDQTLRTEVHSLREELHSLRDELRSSVGELR